jgi:hypothetical protein
MNHTGGGNGISSVKFGGVGSVIGFDRTNPNPGTAGSSTGRDVTFRPSVGAWTLRASYSQPLGLGMTPPVGDSMDTSRLASPHASTLGTSATSNSISTRRTESPAMTSRSRRDNIKSTTSNLRPRRHSSDHLSSGAVSFCARSAVL